MQNIHDNANDTVILGIDTSSKSSSVALQKNGETISFDFQCSGLTHSQTLMPQIKKVVDNAGVSIDKINYIAVTVGPGSFTGLRIGLSSAKGIAAVNEALCIGLSSLEALAYGVEFDGIVCAVMDARCKRVFCALFQRDGEKFSRITDDKTMPIDELLEVLKAQDKPVYLVGDAAQICFLQYQSEIANLSAADGDDMYISGEAVCSLARTKLDDAVDYKRLNPEYIELPQAQRELLKKRGNLK